ncbi:MAG TPA: zinc ribbon domain-containing protein [Thermoanaerobaculia bacterium]|nr:zinc ribbon domain-containing protein [Thermoanaerobaculia bacterium]
MTVDPPNASADRIACASCHHDIDAVARLCPYCGADPRTGKKPVDTQAMLETMFHPRQTSPTTSVVEFARQRQGVVIALGILLGLLLLAGLHEYVTRRNARLVSAAAAIPLTEVTDLSDQQDENRPLPLPTLEYQFDGHPHMMRTFVVESGAVTPPEVLAAQQTATVGPPAKAAQPPKH